MSKSNLKCSIETLDLFSLREAYLARSISPEQVVRESLTRIRERTCTDEWTFLVSEEALLQRAHELETLDRNLPFYGIPFSVKDNIHVEGLPTTASCQAFQHVPNETSPVVLQILAGGGILMGKNTMDQFATGVVGVRSSPHPVNPFNPAYIPGGSSSGSGVVVSKRCVTFALGSDTGGSGRVPAALCNVVGFKPTHSSLSNAGMVYANESIDCIPIFSLSASEAEYVFTVLRNETPLKPSNPITNLKGSKIAIPDANGLRFFGDEAAECSFLSVIEQLKSLGCEIETIDFSEFSTAGNLLFEGGFISERYHSVGEFIKQHKGQVNTIVESVILSGEHVPPSVIWDDFHAVKKHTKAAHTLLDNYDFLLTPTAGTIYRIDEMNANPIELNKNMAYYTNFGNLLDLSVISMPARIRDDGLPFGISLMAKNNADLKLLSIARQWEAVSGIKPGSALLECN